MIILAHVVHNREYTAYDNMIRNTLPEAITMWHANVTGSRDRSLMMRRATRKAIRRMIVARTRQRR